MAVAPTVTSIPSTVRESLASLCGISAEELLINDAVGQVDRESEKMRRQWVKAVRGKALEVISELNHLKRAGSSEYKLRQVAQQFVLKLQEETSAFYDSRRVDSAMHAIDRKIASLGVPKPLTFPPYRELKGCLEAYPHFVGDHPQESDAVKGVARKFAGTKQFGDEIDGGIGKVLSNIGLDRSKELEGTGRLLSYRLMDALLSCPVKDGKAPAPSHEDSLFNDILSNAGAHPPSGNPLKGHAWVKATPHKATPQTDHHHHQQHSVAGEALHKASEALGTAHVAGAHLPPRIKFLGQVAVPVGDMLNNPSASIAETLACESAVNLLKETVDAGIATVATASICVEAPPAVLVTASCIFTVVQKLTDPAAKAVKTVCHQSCEQLRDMAQDSSCPLPQTHLQGELMSPPRE